MRINRMASCAIEHSGYIDIKQPPIVKDRKLKSWKKKWVILQNMSTLPKGKFAAKVDVYADLKTAIKTPADKHTFILEFVTDVREAKSKTREHAFEIIENKAVLLMSGETEIDSQSWISAFNKIFWPTGKKTDAFFVWLKPNEHTQRLSLEGHYMMTITPKSISIRSQFQNSYEWSLKTLKRFHLDKEDNDNKDSELLTIDCGQKSECGESIFQFRSDNVTKILEAIKRNIVYALSQKKTEHSAGPCAVPCESNCTAGCTERLRGETISSLEKQFRHMLENTEGSPKTSHQFDKLSLEHSTYNFTSDTLKNEISSKERQNLVSLSVCQDPNNLFCSPNDIADCTESEYNHVELNISRKRSVPGLSNIPACTSLKPGYKANVLIDDYGYSHLDINNVKHVQGDRPAEQMSNMLSQSPILSHSASIPSKDSETIYSTVNKLQNQRRNAADTSTISFDNTLSTSTTEPSESNPMVNYSSTPLCVNTQEAILITPQYLSGDIQENNLYQYISINEIHEEKNRKIDTMDEPTLQKSSSNTNIQQVKKEYEGQNTFRKNKKDLIKHLGMDSAVDPLSVPPSLPARPTSYKIKRKFASNDKKMFTLQHSRHWNKKSKERSISLSSGSSKSDTENIVSKKDPDISVKVWPLGNNCVTVRNDDLYQPVTTENLMKNTDGTTIPQKRERCSSLNLNFTQDLKRPMEGYCEQDTNGFEEDNNERKHNKIVSLQRNLMKMSSETYMKIDQGTLCQSDSSMISDYKTKPNTINICSDIEPIYTELGPTVKMKTNDIENPFPDLDTWQRCNSETCPLGTRNIQNVVSMDNECNSRNILNQDFVLKDQNINYCQNKNIVHQTTQHIDKEQLLIDLSDNQLNKHEEEYLDKGVKAFDIFSMGECAPLLDSPIHLPPSKHTFLSNNTGNCVDVFTLQAATNFQQTNSDMLDAKFEGETLRHFPTVAAETLRYWPTVAAETIHPTLHESLYMDMNLFKNENIYVSPSSFKP